MKNSENYYAQMVYELRQSPVLENTVLFIESYNASIHGDCRAILQAMLSDDRFRDWKFAWTFPESAEFEELRKEDKDERIVYVSEGSHDFVAMCEQAQVIVTAKRLPVYYIKREKQVVFGCFPATFFFQNEELTRDRVLFQATLDKVDVLYIDNEMVLKRVEEMYPGDRPFKILDGQIPRLSLPVEGKGDILVSLTKSELGTSFADLEEKYKNCCFWSTQYGKKLCFRIDKKLFSSFMEENEPEILAHIVSDETVFCQYAKKSELIITDRGFEAFDALQLGLPCIFISNTRFLPEYFTEKNLELLLFADNWERAVVLLSEYLMKEDKIKKEESAGNGLANLLDIVLEANRLQLQRGHIISSEELWIVPGDIPNGFWQAMKYYKPDKSISVFVRSSDEGRLWKRHIELTMDKRFYCKIGKCVTDDTSDQREQIFRSEWERMFGKKSFNKAYLWEKADTLWRELYQYVPAKSVEEIDREKTAEILYKNIVASVEEGVPEVSIGGETYYELGKEGTDRYYLKKKADITKATVLFLRKAGDRREYEDMMAENVDLNTTYICIDPYQYMRTSNVLEKDNVYWVPRNILPLHLLAMCESVYGYESDVIFDGDAKILY